MSVHQPGLLAPVPAHALYCSFNLSTPDSDPRAALAALAGVADGERMVVGLGPNLVQALGVELPGLRPFPILATAGINIPSTPFDLWCWLRGDDRGTLLHAQRALQELLAPTFQLQEQNDAFKYGPGLDLTGYEDGTENPHGDDALAAAFVADGPAGLLGSSFVAVQRWQHNWERFDAMSGKEQDHSIGRRRKDNEELDDAPASAHVKRTAQENFQPAAFVLRRSMPWSGPGAAGLMFVACGARFDAFEAQLKRMVGLDDGISDALFRFTRPQTGAYFWCPPVRAGQLDLSALGL